MATESQLLNFRAEADRLKTFTSWPVSYMDPRKLAEAGFYYLNRGDIVKCAFCGLRICNWEEGDDPVRDHQRYQASCPFLLKISAGNIPLSENDNSSTSHVPPRSNDECGPYDWTKRSIVQDSTRNSRPNTLEKLGINLATSPVFSSYPTTESRLKTFNSWPVSGKQSPEKLSEAGFFYTGNGDKTICYHCGGGLQDWKDIDDPWVEHAKWFPKCSYVRLNKGLDFIARACDEKVSPISPTAIKNLTIPLVLKDALQIKKPDESSALSIKTEEKITKSHKEEDDNLLCKICFQEEMSIVFLPCRHLIACAKCASSLSECAVCRKPVTATVQAFLS